MRYHLKPNRQEFIHKSSTLHKIEICLFIYYIRISIVCTKLLSTFVNRMFTLYIHDVENEIKLRMYMLCIIYTLCKSRCCKMLLMLNFFTIFRNVREEGKVFIIKDTFIYLYTNNKVGTILLLLPPRCM